MLNQPSDTSPSSLKEPLEDILFKLRFHTVLDCWFEALKPLLKQLIPYLHTDPRCRGVLLEMLELYEYDSSFPHEVADLLLDHFPEDPGVRRFMQIFGLSSYGEDGMVSESVHKLCYRRQIDPAFWLTQAVHGSVGRYWPSRRSGCTGKDHTSTCEDIVDHQLAKGESRLFPVWAARRRHWKTTAIPECLIGQLQPFDLNQGGKDRLGVQPPDSSSTSVEAHPKWLCRNSRYTPHEWRTAVSLAQALENAIRKSSPELEPLLVLAQVDRSPQTRDYLLDEWQKLDSKSQSRRLLTLFLAWKFADDPVVAPALSGANELSAYRDGIDPLQIHLADPDFSKCSQDDALWEPLMQSLHHARGNKLYRFLNTIGRLILRFGRQERARDELIKRLKASGEPYLANAALKEYDGHWEVDVAVLSLEALALCWPDHPETREMVETAVYSPVERIQDVAACILGRVYIGDEWADALLRSALMESSDFLAEYLVRNLGREEVVDEAFALMEHLPDQWEHSNLYESAPQCIIAFFGPRYDLLDRLAALMKRTPHKEMKEAIADLLITYSSQCEQSGLVSPWEECRLRAIRAQHPDVSQLDFVPLLKKMALNDPVMEVRLAALGKLLTKDEAKVFAAEVVEELVMEGEFRATELLCSAKAGDENLAAWLTSFAPGSPFRGPCEELFHLLKTYFLRTTATRDYMRGMLRNDLAAKELNAHLWLLTVDLGDIEFLCLEFDRWIHEKRLRFYILVRLMNGYMKTMSRLERVNTIERLVTGRDFAGRHHLVTALLMLLQPLRIETGDELSDSDLARVEALIDDLLARAPLSIRLGLHRVIERRATKQDSERWWAFYLNSLFPMLAEVDKEAEKTTHTLL